MSYKPEIEALLLGALADGPLHGYRITQVIKDRSGGLLKLGDNQIYPALHRLESEGLIDAEWLQQEGKPARKVYALTDCGRKRLEQLQREWKQYAANFALALGLGGNYA